MKTLAIEMTGIRKSFGGIKALRGVDLRVRAGTVHALVGENGAGKSTLLKILQGVHVPNDGSIVVHGVPMQQHSPKAAREVGLGMIFQELSLVPTMTVAENIFLNHEPRRGRALISRREERRAAGELLTSLGMDIAPDAPVDQLPTGVKQMVEIAKALSQDARVLILDEPTAALSTAEVGHLFDFLRKLKRDGLSAIYVSHRMDEIVEIADDVTILRDGQNVRSASLGEISLEGIVEAMIGKKVSNFTYVARKIDRSRTPVFETRNLTGRAKPKDCSLRVHAGEILGIAGLMGSGRSELARAIYGIDPTIGGDVLVKGKVVAVREPRDAIAAGIVLIPESRAIEGLVVDHSVASNLSLPQIDALASGTIISRGRERKLAQQLIGQLRIKTASQHTPARALSGGNQQKIVIAKWLATSPEVVLLDEPTAGIDIGSKGEIVDLVRDFAETGKAVIVISSEPAELLALADRILVMADGAIVQEIDRSELTDLAPTDGGDAGQMLKAEHALQVAIQKANAHVKQH